MDIENILASIKKLIGGPEEPNEHFDIDLIIFINSVFTTLAQLGVGPATPLVINKDTTWSEFEYHNLEAVKEYVYLKVRTVFDPPNSGSVMNAFNERIKELEWRLNVFAEEIENEE